MRQRMIFNFFLALEGIGANKLRSFLTALGIVFGVAAVIAMLAIGMGAKQSILEQMKLIGANNIVITATTAAPEEEAPQQQSGGNREDKKPWSPGLSLADAQAIARSLPTVEKISPEVVLPTTIVQSGKQQKGRCVGVTNDFFELNKLSLYRGALFHAEHLERGRPVCIIGKSIQTRFFPLEDPVGQQIKCGNTWLTIIGVLDRRVASKESLERLGLRDYNSDIYIPITTALLRFKNRGAVTRDKIGRGSGDQRAAEENYHQLDRIVVRVEASNTLAPSADFIARQLKRRHRDLADFQIEVPELLIEQEQKTQETFNLVLAVIACISLLVGGIGIMNIMLASVLERIKEIGVRRSIGANQQDIVLQFLFEAVFISLIGGLIGIVLGVLAAVAIAAYAEIPTIVSAWSVILSFGVAAAVGLAFGIFPARKAARQDPIKALRTD